MTPDEIHRTKEIDLLLGDKHPILLDQIDYHQIKT